MARKKCVACGDVWPVTTEFYRSPNHSKCKACEIEQYRATITDEQRREWAARKRARRAAARNKS